MAGTGGLEVRDATQEDVPALVELTTSRTPKYEKWWVSTIFEDNVEIHAAPMLYDSDRLVGYGTATHRVGAPEHQRTVQIFVAREESGRGIGSAILARCLAALPDTTTEVWTKVHDDDPESLAVANHWAFEVMQRSISSRVDLAGATSPQPPPGVTLEDCDGLEFDGDDAAAFDAMLAASQTNPEAENIHVLT